MYSAIRMIHCHQVCLQEFFVRQGPFEQDHARHEMRLLPNFHHVLDRRSFLLILRSDLNVVPVKSSPSNSSSFAKRIPIIQSKG